MHGQGVTRHAPFLSSRKGYRKLSPGVLARAIVACCYVMVCVGLPVYWYCTA